ncbi:MAG: aminoglycoside phosphotransferase family protein, partial [Acidimicrobiales bacterium]|nr:aminoglycoside phosphotransferase family protein [Acidimicrobiales bacterium]
MRLERSDPVFAVIAPPRVPRFRELAGLGADDVLTADFSGWSKLVVLSADRAFLFPRDHTQVAFLHREVEALRAVAVAGLREVPVVEAVWDDPGLSPLPVVVVTRRPGQLLADRIEALTADEVGDVLEQLASLAARWHEADPGPLAQRPPRTHPPQALVDDLLGRLPLDDAVAQAAAPLDLDAAERAVLADALERARSLAPVLVHGDVHEGQVLVDDDLHVTGVIDWQTARVGHPFTEFDLGEWGTGTWRGHRLSFPELRRRQWAAYADVR